MALNAIQMDLARVHPSPTRLTLALRRTIVNEAMAFITATYNLTPYQRETLATVPIQWKRCRRASRFERGGSHRLIGPRIRLCVPTGKTASWTVYSRRRIGLSPPPQGIQVPIRLFATAVLIHELTHAVQDGLGVMPSRCMSEVETTRNEITYVRSVSPEVFSQLQVMKAKPRRKRRKTAPLIDRQDLGVFMPRGCGLESLWRSVRQLFGERYMRNGA